MSRTWTFDERLDHFQQRGTLAPPFTDAERGLARSAGEAAYFYYTLAELPARCPDESLPLLCLDFGIARVQLRRDGSDGPWWRTGLWGIGGVQELRGRTRPRKPGRRASHE
jgi:hypothetical protein